MHETRPYGRPSRHEPPSVVFEERGDILWLRGADAHVATGILGLQWEGQAIGFDQGTALLYAQVLLRRNVQVSIRQGATLRTLTLQRALKPSLPPATPIHLAVDALFDGRELQQIQKRFQHAEPPWIVGVASELLCQDSQLEPLYVYKVDSHWYEVDWELTAMSERRFHLLVLAAHDAGRTLPCQLVEPKPRRRQSFSPKRMLQISEPVVYGQLGFEL